MLWQLWTLDVKLQTIKHTQPFRSCDNQLPVMIAGHSPSCRLPVFPCTRIAQVLQLDQLFGSLAKFDVPVPWSLICRWAKLAELWEHVLLMPSFSPWFAFLSSLLSAPSSQQRSTTTSCTSGSLPAPKICKQQALTLWPFNFCMVMLQSFTSVAQGWSTRIAFVYLRFEWDCHRTKDPKDQRLVTRKGPPLKPQPDARVTRKSWWGYQNSTSKSQRTSTLI